MWEIRHYTSYTNINIMNFCKATCIFTLILVPSTCRIISDINTRCTQGLRKWRSSLSPQPNTLTHTHFPIITMPRGSFTKWHSRLLAAFLFASTAVNSTLQIQTSVFFYAPRHLTFIQIDLMYFLD